MKHVSVKPASLNPTPEEIEKAREFESDLNDRLLGMDMATGPDLRAGMMVEYLHNGEVVTRPLTTEERDKLGWSLRLSFKTTEEVIRENLDLLGIVPEKPSTKKPG